MVKLILGVSVGLFVASLLVPPDPVDVEEEARVTRKIVRIVNPKADEAFIEQVTEEGIRRKRMRTSWMLQKWALWSLGAAGIVWMVQWHQKHPSSLPRWWPRREALIKYLEDRKRER